ncbi:MAG: STAS domain-containing protein [SAR324 cluster bacterium]|nr:STAS domain-containing protein [SAR324 cluster bacterium]
MNPKYHIKNNIGIVSIGNDCNSKDINTIVTPLLQDETLKGLVINLAEMIWIDSSTIGVIVDAFLELKKQQKLLLLCQLNEKVHNTFKLIRLDTTIGIYETERKAIAHIELKSK